MAAQKTTLFTTQLLLTQTMEQKHLQQVRKRLNKVNLLSLIQLVLQKKTMYLPAGHIPRMVKLLLLTEEQLSFLPLQLFMPSGFQKILYM